MASLRSPPNTFWVTVNYSGTSECDGIYCSSTAPESVSESGIKSEEGYWNGKMAWDRVDGKAARNPSLSYSSSYKSWRIARLDGHLAYTIVNDEPMPPQRLPWDVYKLGEGPAPKVTVHATEALARAHQAADASIEGTAGVNSKKRMQCSVA